MDQPIIDGINTYYVSKAAREIFFKVAFYVLGGDELFGGYPSFKQVPKMVRLSRPLDFLGKTFHVITTPVVRHFTSP